MLAVAQQRDLFDYATALTPSVIALVVAHVAYRQWRIARQKLRLDLYAKRFAAFEATLQLYQALLAGESTAPLEVEAAHRKFITAMIESRFLFASSSELRPLLEDFSKSAFFIRGSREVLKTDGVPKELYSETLLKLNKEHASMESRLLAIEKAMAPYLTFRGLVD